MVSVRPSYGGRLNEYYCISEDVKPTGESVKNGSTLVEIDTGFKYLFDAQNRQWIKQAGSASGSSGSGSGSSGSGSSSGSSSSGSGTDSGSGVSIVNMLFSYDLATGDYELVSFDSSYDEIYDKISRGVPVLLHVRTSATSAGNTVVIVEGHAFMNNIFSLSQFTNNIKANVILESSNDYMAVVSIVLDSSDNVEALLHNYYIAPGGGSASESGPTK